MRRLSQSPTKALPPTVTQQPTGTTLPTPSEMIAFGLNGSFGLIGASATWSIQTATLNSEKTVQQQVACAFGCVEYTQTRISYAFDGSGAVLIQPSVPPTTGVVPEAPPPG